MARRTSNLYQSKWKETALLSSLFLLLNPAAAWAMLSGLRQSVTNIFEYSHTNIYLDIHSYNFLKQIYFLFIPGARPAYSDSHQRLICNAVALLTIRCELGHNFKFVSQWCALLKTSGRWRWWPCSSSSQSPWPSSSTSSSHSSRSSSGQYGAKCFA